MVDKVKQLIESIKKMEGLKNPSNLDKINLPAELMAGICIDSGELKGSKKVKIINFGNKIPFLVDTTLKGIYINETAYTFKTKGES